MVDMPTYPYAPQRGVEGASKSPFGLSVHITPRVPLLVVHAAAVETKACVWVLLHWGYGWSLDTVGNGSLIQTNLRPPRVAACSSQVLSSCAGLGQPGWRD